ncbi:serine dehydratase beta chain [Limosilactobacillus fermentum]|uniref:serine dehydratase beta chain n=1 Tax=Limosilactobacillus fermentum TaxID=1613 RepID=UPI00315E984B
MTENYRSVFDIIGPIMIGPSSSHTAGAVAIGRVARQVLDQTPVRVTVQYYESFAQTHQGHGTDYAIVAGLLQMDPADPRVPNSRELASQAGIEINFVEEPGASPIGHPNTAVLDLEWKAPFIKQQVFTSPHSTIWAFDLKDYLQDDLRTYLLQTYPGIICLEES